MKLITIIIITILNNLGCAEEAQGWRYAPGFKRAVYQRAMLQKDGLSYLCEYRRIWKPEGEFYNTLKRSVIPSSKAKADVLDHIGIDEIKEEIKYYNKEWWLAFRVIISIDKNNPKSEELVNEEGFGQIIASLENKLSNFPDEEYRNNKTKKATLRSSMLSIEPSLGMNSSAGMTYDEAPDMFTAYNKIFFPVISTWYTNRGAPYTTSPHVVQSMWFWHKYIEDKDIKDYIASTKKEMEEQNAKYGKKLCVYEVKSPAP